MKFNLQPKPIPTPMRPLFHCVDHNQSYIKGGACPQCQRIMLDKQLERVKKKTL